MRLAGRLARRVYPGPPNYESVAAGDAPDTVLVLRLDRPACTRASREFAARAGVREVQLLVSRSEFERAGHMLGQRVVLRGTLEGAVWGWHHLPVLLATRLPAAPASRSAAAPRRQVRPNEALQLTSALGSMRLKARRRRTRVGAVSPVWYALAAELGR